MTKNAAPFLLLSGSLLLISGCSSMVTHSGGNQGYYPGTKANMALLQNDNTSWAMAPLVLLDMPFSAMLDTLLLPYDYWHADQDKAETSPRERVLRHEKETQPDRQSRPAPSATATASSTLED